MDQTVNLLLPAALTVIALAVGTVDYWIATGAADGQARPKGLTDNALASGETGSLLVAPRIREALKEAELETSQLQFIAWCYNTGRYPVLTVSGGARCASLVPGFAPYASQLYVDSEHEIEQRDKFLRNLKRSKQ